MAKSVIVIGAGIMGLATAKALAEKKWEVTVIERSTFAQGASIRNFGMIWPIGQPSGKLYERAMRTKAIWKEICHQMGYWFEEAGSLHLAQTIEEAQVMQELDTLFGVERPVNWLSRNQLQELSPAINAKNVIGGLWSRDEAIVESRKIIRDLPTYLSEQLGVKFYFDSIASSIQSGGVIINNKLVQSDLICICTGVDFQLLYPDIYQSDFITTKLQMMRTVPQPDNWRIGPSLCGGLSLAHYKSFEEAPSLKSLKSQLAEKYPEYLKHGIHVMVSQNHLGELTIGDSHHYGHAIEPFDQTQINILILEYLNQICAFKNLSIAQVWNGQYSKLIQSGDDYFRELEPGVWALNGLGGAGMTLSFGTMEDFASMI